MQAVVAGHKPDRTPLAFWRHWPDADQDGASLARATVEFQRRYDFDFVKVSAPSNYAVAGWGGGSRRSATAVGSREWADRAVKQPEDWARLRPLDPKAGLSGEMLKAMSLVRAELGDTIPILFTIYNALAQAKYLAGDVALQLHLKTAPDAVAAGLNTITESTVRFVDELRPLGLDGVFFAVQHASRDQFTEGEYEQIGLPSDRSILEAAQSCWLNVLHLHGGRPMFGLAAQWAAPVINWHAVESGPGLNEACSMTDKVLCGGLGLAFPMRSGTPADVRTAVQAVCEEVPRERLILSSGCVLPVDTPEANIAAVKDAIINPGT